MSELEGLVERLRAATGPSTLLDNELAATLGIVAHTFAGERMVPLTDGTWKCPAYTNSVDAALALVERMLPGARVAFEKFPDQGFCVVKHNSGKDEHDAFAPTLPLAICLALVEALQAQESPLQPSETISTTGADNG